MDKIIGTGLRLSLLPLLSILLARELEDIFFDKYGKFGLIT